MLHVTFVTTNSDECHRPVVTVWPTVLWPPGDQPLYFLDDRQQVRPIKAHVGGRDAVVFQVGQDVLVLILSRYRNKNP